MVGSGSPSYSNSTIVVAVARLATAADQRRQLVGELWGVAKAERLRRDTEAGGVGEVLDERRQAPHWSGGGISSD